MHRANIKIINAQQARICNIYKKARLKLLKNQRGIMVQQNVQVQKSETEVYPFQNQWQNTTRLKDIDHVINDEHNRIITVVLAKHEIAPWWLFLREPKHVGAIVGTISVYLSNSGRNIFLKNHTQ